MVVEGVSVRAAREKLKYYRPKEEPESLKVRRKKTGRRRRGRRVHYLRHREGGRMPRTPTMSWYTPGIPSWAAEGRPPRAAAPQKPPQHRAVEGPK